MNRTIEEKYKHVVNLIESRDSIIFENSNEYHFSLKDYVISISKEGNEVGFYKKGRIYSEDPVILLDREHSESLRGMCHNIIILDKEEKYKEVEEEFFNIGKGE